MATDDLARAIIALAVHDASDPYAPATRRFAAQAWLARGGSDLRFWCDAAGLNADFVARFSHGGRR